MDAAACTVPSQVVGLGDGTVPGRSGLAARSDNAVLLALVPAAT